MTLVEVKLHDIGEGMTEGEIIHYFVKEGDSVKADQPLAEVQTDKMVAELPSPASGKVKKIVVGSGSTVPVGTTLLIVEPDNIKAASTEKKQDKPAFDQTAAPLRQTGKRKLIMAAPYTRKVARELGVDIYEIPGTGKNGRITVEDVYHFVQKQDYKNDLKESNTPANQAINENAEPIQLHEAKDIFEAKPDVIPFRGRRKQIAKKMTQSLYTIPHVTHFEEADLTELLAYREALKEMGIRISAVAFFIKAIIIALKEYPVFNAKLDEENEVIRLEKEYHIGIATDTKEGLIVPVIHHADRLTVRQIHEKLKTLTRKAQENKLGPSELKGSTFTVSNVGPLGSIGATPIIHYPETGLISFHKTKKRPVVMDNDEIAIRPIMTLSMSFDHRVADGATAVAFTNRFKQLIENPKLWLIELT
ncbi:2-oxo acid dehydrogenase subunit E2 [Bacillus coagulans]|nr:2-oxo acid dehydrogenase subunit E2 [Heyndrickxia coagulans]